MNLITRFKQTCSELNPDLDLALNECDDNAFLDPITEAHWQGYQMANRWMPIETAPKDFVVMVYSPQQDGDWPDSIRIDFDHIESEIEEGYWFNHGEHYEHYCCVAPPEGSIGPKEKAPYTHWRPIPIPPLTTKGGE